MLYTTYTPTYSSLSAYLHALSPNSHSICTKLVASLCPTWACQRSTCCPTYGLRPHRTIKLN
jgi:hypothetical protein